MDLISVLDLVVFGVGVVRMGFGSKMKSGLSGFKWVLRVDGMVLSGG